MGLFWSLQPPTGHDPRTTDFDLSTKDPLPITLTAETNDGTRTSRRLVRLQAANGVQRRPLREHGLVGALYTTTARRPRPTVLVLGGSEDGLHQRTAALLASHGQAALALAYFRAPGLPRQLTGIPLEYFARAIAWLRTQPEADSDRILVAGYSRGGELALLLGATYPAAVNSVIALMPSSKIEAGLTADGQETSESAWTLHSRPLPSIPIPVERIDGPVLLVSGTDDRLWPSSDATDAITTRLHQARHRFPVGNLTYQGAGHLIDAPYWPTNLVEAPDDGLFSAATPPRTRARTPTPGPSCWHSSPSSARPVAGAENLVGQVRPLRPGPDPPDDPSITWRGPAGSTPPAR
jgi:dienelactone hydrolase